MSTTLKGFVCFETFSDNSVGGVYHIGELSEHARTYSRKKSEYVHADHQAMRLVTFKTLDSSNAFVQLDDRTVANVLSVAKAVLTYTQTTARPYDAQDLVADISASFYESIEDFSIGTMSDDGVRALPVWMAWTLPGATPTNIKIWLSDEAFRAQYDDYEIEVRACLDPIDHFFLPYGTAMTAIRQITPQNLMELVQQARGMNPETTAAIKLYPYINPLDKNQVNQVPWVVVIYGQAGDNDDAIKQAIIDYVSEHSDHDASDWETIFPDFFQSQEFYVIPRWDKVAVPNQTSLASLYSGIVNPTEVTTFCAGFLSGLLLSTHVQTHTEALPAAYKLLSLCFVAGKFNNTTNASVAKLYPTYLALSNTSPSFSMMDKAAQDWVLFLQDLVVQAELADEYNTLAEGYRKIKRGGKLFIVAAWNKVNFMVAARSNAAFTPT